MCGPSHPPVELDWGAVLPMRRSRATQGSLQMWLTMNLEQHGVGHSCKLEEYEYLV